MASFTPIFLISIIASVFSDECEYQTKSVIVKQPPLKSELYSTDNFAIEEGCVSSASLQDNEVLLKALYISVDPYLSSVFRGFSGNIAASLQISKVIASKSKQFNVGDIVTNSMHETKDYGDDWSLATGPWSTYFIRSAKRLHRIQTNDMPMDYHLSVLGLTGSTAYYGLLDIGLMKEGENVFISGAAGATGSVAGQIAKNVMNGYVVGTAGSNEKVKWLKDDLRFDDALNYKDYDNNVQQMRAELGELFPNGIDMYFDNTGGFVTEAVWPLLNKKARVVLCGQIANYNRIAPKTEDFLMGLVWKEIRVEGFLVSSMDKNRWNDFYSDMAKWIKEDKIVHRRTVLEGFEKTIDAFMGLFSGANIGKMVAKVADA